MICSTSELLRYIENNYISQARELDGLRFLDRVLFENSEYRTQIKLILNRFNRRRLERISFTDSERYIDNRLVNDFLELIKFIKENQGSEILVRKDPEVQQNILSLKEGTSLNRFNEKSKFQKSSKKVLFSKKYFTPKKYFRYVVVCGVLFICVFLYYEYVKEPGGNYRNIRVAESIGTIDISRKGVWSIWRTSFEDIEDALADKKSTKVNHPKITIIKLKDGRYHLFEFGDSEGAVKSKLTKRSKAHKPWEYSKIIYIDLNKCTIVKSIQENCFVCNQFE